MSNNRIYDNTCTANFDETKTGNQQYSYAVQLLLNGGGSWAVEFEGNSFSAKYGQLYIYWNGIQDVVFESDRFTRIDSYSGYNLIRFANGGGANATGLYLCSPTISGSRSVSYTTDTGGLINEWFLDDTRYYWQSPDGPEQATTVSHGYCANSAGNDDSSVPDGSGGGCFLNNEALNLGFREYEN